MANSHLRRRILRYLNPYNCDTQGVPGQYVKGILNDLTKVTLVECIIPPMTGYSTRGERKYYFTSIFPHFIVYGDRHIDPVDKCIAAVHFVVADASTLFYDFDAFGVLNSEDARTFIEQIVDSNRIRLKRDIPTGPDPQILDTAETVLIRF